MPFVFVVQIVNRLFDRHFEKFFAQIVYLAALLVFPLRQIGSRVLNLFLHLIEIFNQLLFLFLGKFVEGFGAQDLAVFDRRHDQTDRHVQQRNALAFGFLLQQFDIFFLILAVFFVNDVDTGLKLVAVGNGGNRHRQILDELVNVFGKLDGRAGRKADGARFIRLFEIIDIGPVVRRRPVLRLFVQDAFDQTGFAGPFGAEAEQVITFRLNIDANLNGA